MSEKSVLESGLRTKMIGELNDKSIFDQVKDYAYQYADMIPERNVFPDKKALEALSAFDEKLPELTGDAEKVLEQLNTYGSPATVMKTGGRYFGFVIGGTLPVALAARWLGDFWDQNAGLYATSPVASKLETVVENWLRQLFGLPENVVSGFVSGTTTSVFCGLAAARYRILKEHGWDVNLKGLYNAPMIRIVAGKQAHGAVIKAITMLGLGLDSVEWVDVDNQGRMIPERIPNLDKNTILILQAGNVNPGSFDPIDMICDRAAGSKAWIHIDGAFGLWTQCSTDLRHLTKGMEKADSWSMDAHKTLNTPYDSGIVMCKDRDALASALHVTGSYLLHTGERDGYSFTPEMSRRSRVIELWAAIKYLGREGVSELVSGLHDRAVQFANEIRKEGFHVINEVVFNQVLVTCENDDLTTRTLERIQASGECWCGGANWSNRKVIRISVSSWMTSPEDITRSVKAFVKAFQEVTKR